MTNYLRISVLTLLLPSLGACAVAGTNIFAEPVLESGPSSVKLDSEGIFHGEQIEFSLLPYTSYLGFFAMGPILPIIPLGFGSDTSDAKTMPFRIRLHFVTEVDNYYFEPEKIILHYQNREISPSLFSGPYTKKSEIAAVFSRVGPGHHWDCGMDTKPKKITTKNIKTQVRGSVCFLLEYPVQGITGNDSFSISFSGLEKDNNTVSIPRILFRPASKFDMGYTGVSF